VKKTGRLYTSLADAAGAKPGDQLDIGGLTVTVATDAECERSSAVVCMKLTVPLIIADNLTGPCADCGDTVQFRPHVPKQPPKVCLDCMQIRALRDHPRRG
jgi:hypothetical protein